VSETRPSYYGRAVTRAPRASRALVPTLVLVVAITAVVSSLGAPLVPSVAEIYDVPVTTAQWSLTAALLSGAVSTPVMGRFATGRLRRPTILFGLGVVTLGAAVSALSVALCPSLELLVAGRALQGVGMALLPLAMAVARDQLVGEHMERTMAVLSVAAVAGAGLGYPITALVAQSSGLTRRTSSASRSPALLSPWRGGACQTHIPPGLCMSTGQGLCC
jgi:MFS family permease